MFFKKEKVNFASPVKGKIIPLSETPDTAFATNKFGVGFSIIPEGNSIVAPTDGKVMFTFETNYGVAIRATNGVEYLIHVGINTYKLRGDGFKCFVIAEQEVKKGDKLIEFNLESIKGEDVSTITPVVFTNIQEKNIKSIKAGNVEQGEDIFNIQK